jgi:hypothetical protein
MTWKFEEEFGLWEAAGKDWRIYINPRPAYCDRGNWLAFLDVFNDLHREVDGQDGWPRYYFDLTRAKLECEAFIKKRGWE